MDSIGDRLRSRRLELGLNQKTLADAAGVTNAAVSKWETNGGRSISANVALRLAGRLKVNPFWLVFGEGEPTDAVRVPDLGDEALAIARRAERLPRPVTRALGELLRALDPGARDGGP